MITIRHKNCKSRITPDFISHFQNFLVFLFLALLCDVCCLGNTARSTNTGLTHFGGKPTGLSMVKEIRKEINEIGFGLVFLAISLTTAESFSSSYSDQIRKMGQMFSWIQRRAMNETAQYEFPKKLEEFGYHFNEAGELRTIEDDQPFNFKVREGDHNYNQQHYDALGEVVFMKSKKWMDLNCHGEIIKMMLTWRYKPNKKTKAVTEKVNSMMEKDYKLQKSYLPADAQPNETRSYVFISGNLYTNNDKLMILIHGSGAVRAGQWSRSLIINKSLEKGSQLPYIKWGRENGYSIIVANTNLNFVDERKKKPVPIRGNGTPEEHVESLWREYVQRSPARNIVIIAHSYGGVCTAALCVNHIREFEERVFAIVLTDSVHGLRHEPQDQGQIDFFKEKAMNWASAWDPLDAPLHTPRSQCPTISAGTDVHELTSYTSMQSIFKYIPKKYDQKVNPEKYKQEYEATPEEPKPKEVTESLIVLEDETGASEELKQKGIANDIGDLKITQNSGPEVESAIQNTAQETERSNPETVDAVDGNEFVGNPGEVQITNAEGAKTGEQKSEL